MWLFKCFFTVFVEKGSDNMVREQVSFVEVHSYKNPVIQTTRSRLTLKSAKSWQTSASVETMCSLFFWFVVITTMNNLNVLQIENEPLHLFLQAFSLLFKVISGVLCSLGYPRWVVLVHHRRKTMADLGFHMKLKWLPIGQKCASHRKKFELGNNWKSLGHT